MLGFRPERAEGLLTPAVGEIFELTLLYLRLDFAQLALDFHAFINCLLDLDVFDKVLTAHT